jgi:hypothetical protein
MQTAILEATNGRQNWGKFLIGVFDDEWRREVKVDGDAIGGHLLARCGWSRRHIWVADLQTGEGAIFLPGGDAASDLAKHRIWVCPLFEPVLSWLYGFIAEAQTDTWLSALPAAIDLPDAPFAMAGYRRSGPTGKDSTR